MAHRFAPVALVAVVAACGASASSVPVKGPDPDVALLAGKWQGEYAGTESGRKGSISFDLTLGHHTAEGQVLMHPEADARTAVPLQIKFVSVGGGHISGKIAPYTDPGCKCTVDSEFVGTITGAQMAGTFTTSGEALPQGQTGRWSAHRTADR